MNKDVFAPKPTLINLPLKYNVFADAHWLKQLHICCDLCKSKLYKNIIIHLKTWCVHIVTLNTVSLLSFYYGTDSDSLYVSQFCMIRMNLLISLAWW